MFLPRRHLATAVVLGLTLSLGASAIPTSPAAAATRSRIVTLRTVHTTVKGAKATTVAATYHGTNRYVKGSLETAVTALAAAQLAEFNEVYAGGRPGGVTGEYTLTGTLIANASPVLALKFDEYVDFAGAHPMEYFHVIVVNSRTGTVWSQRDLARALKNSAAPGVDLLTQIRRRVTDIDSMVANSMTLDDVTLVPTSSGLRVLIDRCVFVCVAGSLQFTIGWKRLLDPTKQVAFVPAIWRR